MKNKVFEIICPPKFFVTSGRLFLTDKVFIVSDLFEILSENYNISKPKSKITLKKFLETNTNQGFAGSFQ